MSALHKQACQNWVDLVRGIGTIRHSVDGVLCSFPMPLSFLLSGLFFQSSLKRCGARAPIGRKADTLISFYVVWSLVQGGIELALSRLSNTHQETINTVAILRRPLAQFWFLYVLVIPIYLMHILFATGVRMVLSAFKK